MRRERSRSSAESTPNRHRPAIDWSLSAGELARSIVEHRERERPLHTFWRTFRIELLTAELASREWPRSMPGTVVERDDDGFVVVAGDGAGVKVRSALVEYGPNRTPFFNRVVRSAGGVAPIVLTATPTPWKPVPYWKRSRLAWDSGSHRSLIVYLGGSPEEVIKAAARLGSAGVDSVVVDISGDGALAADYPWLQIRSPEPYAASQRVRAARTHGIEWLQEIATQRLTMSGRTFLDTFSDGDTPAWWRFEISLQERAFMAIRLVELVQEVIRRERVQRVTIVGGEGHWPRAAVLETCRAHGIAVAEVQSGAQQVDSRPRPQEKRLWWHVPVVGSAWIRILGSLVTKLLAIAVGIPLAAVGAFVLLTSGAFLIPIVVILAALLAVLTALLPPEVVALIRARSRRLPIGIRMPRLTLGVLTSRAAILMGVGWLWLVLLIIALVRFPSEMVVMLLAGLLAAVVWYVALVLIAPSDRDVGATLRWPIRRTIQLAQLMRPRQILRALVQATARRPKVQPGPVIRSRFRVVLLIDEGNVRVRRQASRRGTSSYNPYIEGVAEAFARHSEVTLTTVSYGDAVLAQGPLGPLQQYWRRIRPGKRVPLRAFYRDAEFEAASALARRRGVECAALEEDPGFRKAFRYCGIDLWPAMRDNFESAFTESARAPAFEAALARLLEVLKPDLVVNYNFEGVFRRMLPAIVRRQIPLLGVQQALGPYGHALDHRVAGYDRPLARHRNGVPAPDRIAVWGDRDVANLTEYGHARDAITVSGYARSDTFVREARSLDRRRILRRLRMPANARVMIYSPVLRVLGEPLLSDRQWADGLKALLRVAKKRAHLFVLVKPWPGDDIMRLQSLMDEASNEKVGFVDPYIDVHNVELLGVTDAVVGTFSSFLGEALLAGAVPVMLDYPGAAYYFGDYPDRYRNCVIRVTSQSEIEPAVAKVLDGGAEFRESFVRGAWSDLQSIFGPLDGNSAERIVAAGLELAAATRSRVYGDGHLAVRR